MNKGFNENKYLCVETGSLKLKGHVLYCTFHVKTFLSEETHFPSS